MFIQIYAGNFFPEKTGIGKYTGEMAAWLAARGHQVRVITGHPYYPEWKLAPPYRHTAYRKERWCGVSIHRVPHYIPRDGRVTSLRRMGVDLSFVLASSFSWLRTLFMRRPPDVIITVSPPLLAGIWPLLVGRLRRIPVVYHVQDYQLDAAMMLGMLRGRLLLRALALLERRLIRSATRVSSITPAMCRRALAKGAAADRLLDLPNWSDVRGIHPIARDTAFRLDLGIDDGQILVMYAGAMGRKQGLELVLDAAAAVQADGRFRFVMIGAGADAEALRAEAAARGLDILRFLPLQPLQRLNEVLGSADIQLVVQRADAADLVMPSKLTNILAAGRPALATAEPGTALFEAVHGARTGLVVPSGDTAAFISALRRLADDPALRASLGHNARVYAERHLDQDVILGRFEEELMALHGGRAAPRRYAPAWLDDAAVAQAAAGSRRQSGAVERQRQQKSDAA